MSEIADDSFGNRHTDSISFDKGPLLSAAQNQTTTVVTANDEENEDFYTDDERGGLASSSSSQMKKLSTLKLSLIVIAFIIMTIVSTVGRKLVLDGFGQHLAFFRQVLGVFMYDIWVSIFVVYKLVNTNEIPLDVRQANPIYLFAGIGFLDGLGDFLSSVGGVHSPGSIQTLLGQLVIPLTLIIAVFVTRSKFTWVQIVAALVIIGGVSVATIPELDKTRSSTSAKTKGKPSAEGEQTYWYSVVVFALSQIPQAASIVCKDFLFKRSRGKLDVFYLSCLVSWTQLWLIWIFLPLQSFPALGGVPLDQIGEVMEDGARCFVGQAVPKDRGAINWTAIDLGLQNASSIERCRSDAYLPLMTFAYSLCGFFQNILQLMIVKYHSASLAMLCSALTLPLSNLAYSVPAFVGGADKAEPFSIYDIVGLVITVLGMLLYQSRALRKQFCNKCWPVRDPNEGVLISGAPRARSQNSAGAGAAAAAAAALVGGPHLSESDGNTPQNNNSYKTNVADDRLRQFYFNNASSGDEVPQRRNLKGKTRSDNDLDADLMKQSDDADSVKSVQL